MASFKCPFCGNGTVLSKENYSHYYFDFNNQLISFNTISDYPIVEIEFFKCHHCERTSIEVRGAAGPIKDMNMPFYPNSHALQFPEYIPEHIRNDYGEACAIVNLSPKAFATLSRRCLQSMIKDFFEIDKDNLNAAINDLEDKIPASQWKAIHSLRQIGNIGAHMKEKSGIMLDVDSGEAELLIKLIERLVQNWYVQRYEDEELYSSVSDMATDKFSN